jgi:ankyrin repeat protein
MKAFFNRFFFCHLIILALISSSPLHAAAKRPAPLQEPEDAPETKRQRAALPRSIMYVMLFGEDYNNAFKFFTELLASQNPRQILIIEYDMFKSNKTYFDALFKSASDHEAFARRWYIQKSPNGAFIVFIPQSFVNLAKSDIGRLGIQNTSPIDCNTASLTGLQRKHRPENTIQSLAHILKVSTDIKKKVFIGGHGVGEEIKQARIADLKISDFRQYLNMLNVWNNVEQLFVNSCDSGGENRVIGYQEDDNNTQKNLPFDVIIFNPSDIPSFDEERPMYPFLCRLAKISPSYDLKTCMEDAFGDTSYSLEQFVSHPLIRHAKANSFEPLIFSGPHGKNAVFLLPATTSEIKIDDTQYVFLRGFFFPREITCSCFTDLILERMLHLAAGSSYCIIKKITTNHSYEKPDDYEQQAEVCDILMRDTTKGHVCYISEIATSSGTEMHVVIDLNDGNAIKDCTTDYGKIADVYRLWYEAQPSKITVSAYDRKTALARFDELFWGAAKDIPAVTLYSKVFAAIADGNVTELQSNIDSFIANSNAHAQASLLLHALSNGLALPLLLTSKIADIGRSSISHGVATKEILQILWDHKFDFNTRCFNQQRSLLHIATMAGNQDAIEFLAAHGFTLDITDNLKQTPVHLAAQAGNELLIEVLLPLPGGTAALTCQDNNGKTPLHRAARDGHPDAARILLSRPEGLTALAYQDGHGRTPLHIAAFEGQTETARILLSIPEGLAALTCPDKYGRAPLHLTACRDHTETAKVLLSISKGPIVLTHQDKCGNSPLHCAVFKGHTETARELLCWPDGLSVLTCQNQHKNTPLHVAALKDHRETAQMLLCWPGGKSALPCQNQCGDTPLACAVRMGNIEVAKELLLYSEAQATIVDAKTTKCLDAISNPETQAAMRQLIAKYSK